MWKCVEVSQGAVVSMRGALQGLMIMVMQEVSDAGEAIWGECGREC